MKLTDKTCPSYFEAEAHFIIRDESGPDDDGAHITFGRWVGGRRRRVRLKVNDYILRTIADYIEQTAMCREARANYLRRK